MLKKENLLTNSPENWSVYSGEKEILKYSVNETVQGLSLNVETGDADFCLLSHRFTVENNSDLYEMSADVFLDEECCESSTISLRAAFIDEMGNWHGYSQSNIVTTLGQWYTLKKVFYGVKIEKCLFEIVVNGKNTIASAKNICLKKKRVDLIDCKNVNREFTVACEKTGKLSFGFGAEADPKFFSGSNTREIPDLEGQWQIIEEKISKMKPHFVRMMLLPHIYEPERNVFSLETEGCKQLFKYLDVFQKHGVRVNLTWWCVAREQMLWLAFGKDGAWCSPPNDSMHAAEMLALFLKKLIEEKGYTCIKDVILMNEPNESYVTDKGIDFEHYAEFYRRFDLCLKNQGIRNKITLIGGDDTGRLDWTEKCHDNLDDILDAYSTHVYRWNFYDDNLDVLIKDYTKKRSSFLGKPLFFGEFGQETRGNYVVESVQHSLFMAAFAINALKGGATGASYWTLFDVYYGFGEKNMMDSGMWAYYDRNWETKPSGVVWEMLIQNTSVNDDIYNIDGEGLDGLVFDSGARKTIALLNRSSDIVNATIKSSLKGEIEKCMIFNKDLWDKSNSEPGEWKADLQSEKITSVIPPESFVIMIINTEM